MELTKEVNAVLTAAAGYAKKNKYELITPEIVLLFICDDICFSTAFGCSGGDVNVLRSDLEKYISYYGEKTTKAPEFSTGMSAAFSYAARSASNSGSNEVSISHIIHGMWQLDDLYAVYFMQKQEIEEAELLSNMAQIADGSISEKQDADETVNEVRTEKKKYDHAVCLNDTLRDVNPLIGREEELERTIQILCRRDKNNPLHIGEPGVGKTALTYGLVMKIVKGDVPDPLKGSKVFTMDLGSMLAGSQYRGEFEKRFKKMLSDIGKEKKPIIYIDEIHNIAGAGAVGESSFDAANMLKGYLTDGHIRFIGATTYEDYKKHFEKHKSLVRRFQNVEIKEPTSEECVKILEGLKSRYESFHGVKYAEGVLGYAVDMSRHISERYLPDKAIDIIDEAGAYRKLHPTDAKIQTVDKDIINTVLTKICRVPIETVETEDLSGLEKLEDDLKSKIFGQDEAIAQSVNAIKFSKAGLLDENKPLASLLFVGPTGVGKTEIAKQLASELGLKLVRFDMSEYEEKHAVAKLIGSPAGYVGYEEGGLLTEEIRKNPSCVLLLDEIEKAHPDIYNILLQIMDYATLTDNQGRKADFSSVIVIMTSNAGANRIGKSVIGFESVSRDSSAVMEEVKRIFQPEFRNRLDRIVVFNGMDEDMADRVIAKKLRELSAQLERKHITLAFDKAATDLIREKGITSEYGAREADRVIRNEIKPLFVDEILFGRLKNGGRIMLSAADGSFTAEIES